MPPAPPLVLSLALALALALPACDGAAPSRPPAPSADTASPGAALPPDTAAAQTASVARARIEPVGRGGAEGTVTLAVVERGTRVRVELSGLSAQGFHGLQVLRGRDCDADPALHLGVEAGTPHGGIYSPPGLRHAGDLGNVRGDGGRGRYDRVDPVLGLDGPTSAVGRAVVVRAGRDDASSPDGAAGDVIGCGVLEAVR